LKCDEKSDEGPFQCAVLVNGTKYEPKPTRFRCAYKCAWDTPTYLTAIESMSKLNARKEEKLSTCTGNMCNENACLEDTYPTTIGIVMGLLGACLLSYFIYLMTLIYRLGCEEFCRVSRKNLGCFLKGIGACFGFCSTSISNIGTRIEPNVVPSGTYELKVKSKVDTGWLIYFYFRCKDFLYLIK